MNEIQFLEENLYFYLVSEMFGNHSTYMLISKNLWSFAVRNDENAVHSGIILIL
jgi:hypothetical protein